MEDQKKIQEKIIRYQVLEGKLNALINRRDLLVNKIMEMEITLNSIDEIKNNKGDEILLPLGSNVYIPGAVNKKEKMIVELGAKVAVEKNMENTKEIIEDRKKIIENGVRSVENQIISLSNEMRKLEPELRSLIERAQNKDSETSAG